MKIGKIFAALAAALAAVLSCSCRPQSVSADGEYNLSREDLCLRDPFVFADKKTNKYYIHANVKIDRPKISAEEIDKTKYKSGLYCYESKDLKHWRYAGKSFEPPADFWGKEGFWAPDMFELGGKYYIIATCHNGESVEIFHKNKMRVKPQFRGCFALVSDRPDGGYKLVSKEPLTPKGQMCLDGTLWEENGKLYLIYCREWVQMWDGEVVACEVARDLSKLVGEPKVLFTASAAKWNNISRSGGKSCGVTDAPVVNRAEDGTLFMTWSSGGTCADGQSRYVVACAVSDNGSIFGNWIQDEIPLNCDDGGHAMLFKTFGGKTKIAYHAPNKKPFCHTVIADFSFKNGKASIAPEKD